MAVAAVAAGIARHGMVFLLLFLRLVLLLARHGTAAVAVAALRRRCFASLQPRAGRIAAVRALH